MGYDLNRFEGTVDEELICSICSFVLEDPVQAPDCEHAFCNTCINEWLKHQSTCPIDRTHIESKDLKSVPRILKNLLSKLKLKCDYSTYGCNHIVRLENLNSHLPECEFNPKKPIICNLGCNIVIPKDELKNHNCIKELRKVINEQQIKINNLSNDLTKQKIDLEANKSELRSFKNLVIKFIKSNSISSLTGSSSPVNIAGLNLTDDDDIARWSSTLPIAKVTRWGGIISTPDIILQSVIKRALIDCGCPNAILDELMNNAHEKNWPPGLNTLETRQINRSQYSNYICKRVPNKQAVLILACDNRHMSNHMVIEPGAILIFAHGIE